MTIGVVAWRSELSVGVPEIDEQHKHLFSVINEFYTGLAGGRESALAELLEAVEKYAVSHFQTEERLFLATDYYRTQEHTEAHQTFVAKVSDIRQRFVAGKTVLTMDLTSFLRTWLIEHIQSEDQLYQEAFRACDIG